MEFGFSFLNSNLYYLAVLYVLLTIVTALEASSVELFDRYGTMLLEQLNATAFAATMHDRRLIGSEDLHVINSAVTEYQKNSYILARVQSMDNFSLLRFIDILQSLDHQQHVGMPLINGNNLC